MAGLPYRGSTSALPACGVRDMQVTDRGLDICRYLLPRYTHLSRPLDFGVLKWPLQLSAVCDSTSCFIVAV